MKRLWLVCLAACLPGAVVSLGQETAGEVLDKARQEFTAGRYAAAEIHLRELTKVVPQNVQVHAYLGHALFRQEKFAEAIGPYEKALELEAGGAKVSEQEHRILVDQLAMSYGIGGQIKKAFALLDEAIRQDPDYPLNYYNLACAYAEQDDKAKVLSNLDLAFQRKANTLQGEQMPDPRSDSSFQKYARDPDFVGLMKKLGYQ
ncbi:MAG: tetratricopeptide repeat protein [Bryobacterales bacterium]